jgi:hypothetical protein
MMRLWNAVVVFAMIAGGTTVGAEARDANATMELRYAFSKGATLASRVEHRALTETTMNGVTESVETMTDSTRTWHVTDVDADGVATLEQSVEDVTMTSRSSERGEVRWSSSGDADPPPGYEGVRASLRVPLVRLRVTPDGRVLERRELRPCPQAASGDLVIVPFPDEPIEEGHTWTIPDEVIVEVPNGPRKAVRTRLRYRLEAVCDGIATIAVDTTVLTPLDNPQLEARLLERIWNGNIRFDVERGQILGRTTSIDRRVVGFGGPQSSLRYKASLDEKALAPVKP